MKHISCAGCNMMFRFKSWARLAERVRKHQCPPKGGD